MTIQIKLISEKNTELENFIKHLQANSSDRNKDWFAPLLDNYLNYYKFFVAVENEEIIGFSAIQTHNFESDNCARVLTRTYYDDSRRNKSLCYSKGETLAVMFLGHKLQYVKDFQSVFISMEYPERKTYLKVFCIKLEKLGLGKWNVLNNMYLTCPAENSFSCWQNVAVLNNSYFPLRNITVEEWRNRYGYQKKQS